MKHYLASLIIVITTLYLSSCGGGVSSSSTSPTTLSGVVSNNIVSGADITVCPIISGVRQDAECQTFPKATNVQGKYEIDLSNFSSSVDAFYMSATGGTYKDEATGQTITLTTTLESLAPKKLLDNKQKVNVTTITHLAAKKAIDLKVDTIKNANQKIKNQFFGENSTIDILTTSPANLVDNTNDSAGDATDYGLILASISQLREDNNQSLEEALKTLKDDIDITQDKLDENKSLEIVSSIHKFLNGAENSSGITQENTQLDTINSSTKIIAPNGFENNISLKNNSFLQDTNISDLQVNNHSSSKPKYLLVYDTKKSASTINPFDINTTTGEVILTRTLNKSGNYYAKVLAVNLNGESLYTIKLSVIPTTTVNISSGKYAEHQTIVLTTDKNATIYYTLNGGEPDSNSTKYTIPIELKDGVTTLKYFSKDSFGNSEVVQSQTYTIDSTLPTFAQYEDMTILLNKIVTDDNGTSNTIAPNINSLVSDNLTADENISLKIANFSNIPSSFGISLGDDGANSANYATTRPKGNDIHIKPQTDFIGSTQVILSAKDELGNESNTTFNVNIVSSEGDFDSDGLINKVEYELKTDMDSNKTWDDEFSSNDDTTKYSYRVMNRLAYGVNYDLIEELKTKGVDNWIEEQLSNPQINLDNNSLDINNSAQQKMDSFYNRIFHNEILATIRPLHSKNQLQSVMARFWDNHFSTYEGTHNNFYMEIFENDNFYLNALGNFKTLLQLSAKSYTMSKYLNGDLNVKGNPNENYAREIMELHTLGVESGYTEKDVAELAKIFTGWGYYLSDEKSRYLWYNGAGVKDDGFIYKFDFNSDKHEEGDKIFLENLGSYNIVGKSGNEGVNEGLEAIDILAKHPKTAEFICYKLAQFFVSDNPSQTTLDACKQEFLAGAGTIGNNDENPNQIANVLRVLFATDEFKNVSEDNLKLKDNQEYLLSLARLLDVNAIYYSGDDSKWWYNFGYYVMENNSNKQKFFDKIEPTGYPEVSSKWNKTDIALVRIQLANMLINSVSKPETIIEYLQRHNLYSVREILQFFIPITTGGFYDNATIKNAYDILVPNGVEKLDESSLRIFMGILTESARFQLQ